jgi:hypothetical protein
LAQVKIIYSAAFRARFTSVSKSEAARKPRRIICSMDRIHNNSGAKIFTG